ncbi:hypothetical protein AN214_02200 [Pseudoalteromonas sp. P1-9]|uniref:hypothetical protein n=1 Tax=Pseudoalteromonas sp. P1-9 TaxID=1710354 RepID=UPI0006D633B9|nr:hypothetical protein [Pseudoalteromonas sp. P1-9]KPV95632.1 hypothetical protein AN214_02200 [Pseudoalteromonas sp. P1-9]
MELIEKHWIKIPVILYVVGFIVHNVYLSNFGSYEFQLVQAKYILSGFGVIGFSVICFVYTGIKVNLSNINKSLTIDKVLPWSLRVISLPYFIYTILYGKELFEISQNPTDSFLIIGFLASTIAHTVVAFSIFNIVMMVGQTETWVSKLLGFLSRVLSIPMLIVSLVIAFNIPEFSGILKATTFFFLGYIGIALNQDDKYLGIEPNYSDPETKEKHENLYQMAFGIIGIFFILWMVISNYTKYIYPKIPVALGGAKLEFVSIKTKEKTYDSYLIQETKDWVMYIDNSSGQVEKIKTSLIEKIVFKEKMPNKSLKQDK